MARVTGAAGKALETKALKADSKSDGMRMLFEKGYEAAEIKEVFDAPYGFVYGVGVRGGFITPSPRASANGNGKAKASATKATKTVAKAKPAAKVTTRAKVKASAK